MVKNFDIEQLEKELEEILSSNKKPEKRKKKKRSKEYKELKLLRKLEKELEEKLKDHRKPEKNNLVPIEKKKEKDEIKKQMDRDLKILKKLEKLEKREKKAKTNNDAFFEQKYTLEIALKSHHSMTSMHGEIFNYTTEKIGIKEDTINLISDTIFNLYSNIYSKFKNIYNQGFDTVIKIFYEYIDANGDIKPGSITMRQNPTIEDIKNKIFEKIINKHIGVDDYIPTLDSIQISIYGLSEKGGCASCKKNVDKLRYRDRTVKLISPKSSNNNCLFMCFAHFLDIKGNTLKFSDIRKDLGIKEGMIEYTDVKKVADYFKCGYVLLNQQQKIISFKDLKNKPTVHIMLMKEHYYIVEYIDYFHCEMCNKKLLTSNTTHVCSNKKITYHRKRNLKKTEFVDMIDCKDKEKIKEDTMIFFDLETFQDKICHVPYACGFSHGDHKNVDISYGKNCMDKFINHIIKQKNKIICAYNGSGFDFYMLISHLKDLNITITNLIMNAGRIMSFRFGKEGEENKIFDLYLFIMSSLDKACEAYNIENKKMKFDVLKIQSWEDSEKYKSEIEPYLKYDVLSLSELFFTFNDSIYEQDNVNITKFITLSNMAYSLWQKSLVDLIEILDMEKYEFSKRGTYGARCYPMKRKFKSKYYDDIVNEKMSYEELKKTNEFIYNADVKSLYPASMAGVDGLLDVKYPTGKSRWSDKPEEEFKKNKCGFYEINYTPPKDIIIPVLPRKTALGGLEWSLFDGSGVFTNVEIKNALSVGYKITFINRCLVWDTTSDKVFKAYVEKYYKLKETAEKNNNPVMRAIAKLLLNAMYGKTLQRAIFQTTNVINDYNELLDFFKNYEITDHNILSENKLLLSGITLDKESKITKPCQLGAFVLSYSREIMLNYMKIIDPTLKTHVFSYTDTDSLHIMGEHYKKLLELGMIEDSLGYLDNDIKKDGIIIYENNLGPKCYIYEYINNKNELYTDDKAIMKCKSIPHKCLNHTMYEIYKDIEPVKFSSLKKKHTSLTKADIEKGVSFFSIVNNTQKRTFNKTEWAGMNFINNCFYPKGYVK